MGTEGLNYQLKYYLEIMRMVQRYLFEERSNPVYCLAINKYAINLKKNSTSFIRNQLPYVDGLKNKKWKLRKEPKQILWSRSSAGADVERERRRSAARNEKSFDDAGRFDGGFCEDAGHRNHRQFVELIQEESGQEPRTVDRRSVALRWFQYHRLWEVALRDHGRLDPLSSNNK